METVDKAANVKARRESGAADIFRLLEDGERGLLGDLNKRLGLLAGKEAVRMKAHIVMDPWTENNEDVGGEVGENRRTNERTKPLYIGRRDAGIALLFNSGPGAN
ncbi:hypothetical protein FGB62_65g212 [Gracilaria domingensis]|nr:hypothetical protein FGB62_65g212 [Gracilaria domingensis]